MTRSKCIAQALVLAVLALAAGSACGDAADETGGSQPQGLDLNVTLGTKNFDEQFLLGQLYKQALAARGYKVTLKQNIGSTEVIDGSLQRGAIDGYPEYLGVAATVLAHQDVAGKDAQQTYAVARDFYASRGQALSEQTRFENVDAIATTVFFAQRHGLQSLTDLRKLRRFTLGARPEFEDRVQGLQGMQATYGLTNATLRPLAIGTQYSALDRSDIDVANVFSTDGQLANGQYKVLEDPKRLFGYQHVALVIDRAKLKRLGGDRFMDVIDRLNARLTTPALIEMNRAVSVEGLEPAAIAQRFLADNGLVRRD
jgi:glycine betaine/choline ABC-type transport system substrate-binding protein